MKHLLPALIALVALASGAHANPYIVKKGDTLGAIGLKHHCPVSALKKANRLRSDNIFEGQKLTIPQSCLKESEKKTITHVVLSGETLESIALRYGMSLSDLKKRNARLLRRGLKRGMKLQVVTSSVDRARRTVQYTIQRGDTYSAIAQRFGVTVADLKRMNPRVKPNQLKIGQRITVSGAGLKNTSRSIGFPHRGRLVDGVQLKPTPGIYIRRSHRAWGTQDTIHAIQAAVAEVRRKHPGIHALAVGDISAKRGGFISPHVSHQSGRDVDLGFYFPKQPPIGPKYFIDGRAVPIDVAPTWSLIVALVGLKSAKASNVQYIFLGYDLQKRLYEYAVSQGVPKRTLQWLFQYPRGRGVRKGVIRHSSGHNNHIHVRFKCPTGDKDCDSAASL